MLIFGLILFVLMLMVSGIAVDVMRYENDRVRMQGTSDRAVLAAASLMNTNASHTPQQLAQAYFDAEGMGQFAQGNISVVDDPQTGRQVSITPSAQMDTMFLRMSNVDHLPMSAPAAAVEGRAVGTKLEIVMVLDRSGSMGSITSTGRSRLAELQDAAKLFSATMLDDFDPDDISISLVSYEGWVVPTPGMLNTMTNVSGSGACLEFDDWDDVRVGNGPPANSNVGGNGNGNGNGWGAGGTPPPFQGGNSPGNSGNAGGNGNGNGNAGGNGNGNSGFASVVNNSSNAAGTRQPCWAPVAAEIKPMQNDLDDIEDAIDAITSGGTTSVDLGARFGAMLLDPSMRDFIDSQVNNGALPEAMRGRPFDWDEPNVERAFILLTDGVNCCGARFSSWVQDDNTLAICDGLKDNDVTVYTVSFEAPQRSIDLLSECASSPNHFFNSDGAGLIAAFDNIGSHVRAQALRLVH